jgi:hypothetical protein
MALFFPAARSPAASEAVEKAKIKAATINIEFLFIMPPKGKCSMCDITKPRRQAKPGNQVPGRIWSGRTPYLRCLARPHQQPPKVMANSIFCTHFATGFPFRAGTQIGHPYSQNSGSLGCRMGIFQPFHPYFFSVMTSSFRGLLQTDSPHASPLRTAVIKSRLRTGGRMRDMES